MRIHGAFRPRCVSKRLVSRRTYNAKATKQNKVLDSRDRGWRYVTRALDGGAAVHIHGACRPRGVEKTSFARRSRSPLKKKKMKTMAVDIMIWPHALTHAQGGAITLTNGDFEDDKDKQMIDEKEPSKTRRVRSSDLQLFTAGQTAAGMRMIIAVHNHGHTTHCAVLYLQREVRHECAFLRTARTCCTRMQHH